MHVLYYAGSMAGSKAEDDCAERHVATGAAGCRPYFGLGMQCVVTEPKEAEIIVTTVLYCTGPRPPRSPSLPFRFTNPTRNHEWAHMVLEMLVDVEYRDRLAAA